MCFWEPNSQKLLHGRNGAKEVKIMTSLEGEGEGEEWMKKTGQVSKHFCLWGILYSISMVGYTRWMKMSDRIISRRVYAIIIQARRNSQWKCMLERARESSGKGNLLFCLLNVKRYSHWLEMCVSYSIHTHTRSVGCVSIANLLFKVNELVWVAARTHCFLSTFDFFSRLGEKKMCIILHTAFVILCKYTKEIHGWMKYVSFSVFNHLHLFDTDLCKI